MRVCIFVLSISFALLANGVCVDLAQADEPRKEEAKPGEAEAPEPIPNVERPIEPAAPPNASELDVRPDADGLVSFSFRGQPWPAVLEWLADVSDKSLEWQEAPPGFLDLTTRGKYSVAEVRDLMNSVLLSRGFTLLDNREMLLVVNLKNLDASLVPRVDPDELEDRGRHELVRTNFDLTRLRADKFVEELQPLLSQYGKATALETANRLDVLETAGNLRRLRDMIRDEERNGGQQTEVREYRLKHVKATETIDTLRTLLGSKTQAGQVALTPEQQQQLMEQLKQMQQKGDSPKMPPRGDEAFLAVNARENSILANAPVDKLAVIEKAIEYLDVPNVTAEAEGAESDLPRMQRYELQTVDPEAIVRVLRELGSLHPTARMDVDAANRALIVQAPLLDHVTVRAVIDKLDVGGRKMEVIQLRRANVEYVASSLEFLLRGADSERPTATRRAQYATDRENNRLFLWANDAELADVRRLLLKLGEFGGEANEAMATQAIPLPPGKRPEDVLRELQRIWPSMSPHPLEVTPSKTPAPTEEEGAAAPKVEETVAEENGTPKIRKVTLDAEEWALAVANAQVVDAPPAQPPVNADAGAVQMPLPISVQPGGTGLVVTSDDPAEVARLKALVNEITANDANRRVFALKNADAVEVAELLEDAYAPPDDDDAWRWRRRNNDDDESKFRWSGFDDLQLGGKPGQSEARPPVIRFLGDPLTNTVMVQGANDVQMLEIEALIQGYDQVPPPDSQPTRQTKIVKVKYASATELTKVVKDVYRDLLSPDDPAILESLPNDQRRGPYSNRAASSRNNRPQYKGLLSIGVNEELNTLVISATGEVMGQVTALVTKLDSDALAEQPVAEVRQVNGIVHDQLLRAVLNNAVDPESESSVSVQMRGSERRDDGRRRNYGRGR
jgi:type II secretory pathway component GspD/PulD (secretin)